MEVDTNFDPVALEKELVQLGKAGEEAAAGAINASSSENSDSEDESANNQRSHVLNYPTTKVSPSCDAFLLLSNCPSI
jgi:hypothetical protein